MERKQTHEELDQQINEIMKGFTQGKQTDVASHLAAECVKQLFENLQEAVAIGDEKRRILRINRKFTELFGYTSDEITGKNIDDLLIPEQDRKDVFSKIKLAEKGIRSMYEGVRRCKDGTLLYVSIIRIPILINNKRVGGFGIWRDITDHKKTEIALQESEENYRLLVDTMNDGLGVCDENGSITYVNKRLCEMLGYSKDDLIEQNAIGFLDEANKNIFKELATKCKKNECIPTEIAWTKKNREKIHTITSPQAIFNSEGKFKAGFVVITNVNTLKKAEQVLIEREKELQIQRDNREEANVALRVLLRKRDEDKAVLEEKVLSNLEKLVMPYLEKLKKTGLDGRQNNYVNILESNLKDIISPFSHKLSSRFLNLTPAEIQAANLVQQGKTTKEIGDLLHLSHKTIEDHRKNIRRKFGIKNKKVNLRTYLISIQ